MALPGLDLRDGVQDLSEEASRALDPVWASAQDPQQAEAGLRDLLPGVLDLYGMAAGGLASEWYDNHREAAGVRGLFSAIPADIPNPGAHSLIGWAASKAQSVETMRSMVDGGMQRRIANYSRQTIMTSSIADPRADGWQRVGSGRCKSGFCDMLIARGAVYTEATAFFASHDHCKCSAVPAFGGKPRPVKPYKPSLKHTTPADRRRVREWIDGHPDMIQQPPKVSLPTGPLDDLNRLPAPETYKEALKVVNPPSRQEYMNNCHFVANAMEMRARGFNVVAAPTYGKTGRFREAIDLDFVEPGGGRRKSTYVVPRKETDKAKIRRYGNALDENIHSAMKRVTADWPPGARGQISGDWKNGGGHIFNMYKDADGTLRFVDGQVSKADAKRYLDNMTKIRIRRIDDLEPNPERVRMSVENEVVKVTKDTQLVKLRQLIKQHREDMNEITDSRTWNALNLQLSELRNELSRKYGVSETP